tara:strand:+ start:866 stop:1384 length:519 start_codon:yes stop_codon:yes gene_type:complete
MDLHQIKFNQKNSNPNIIILNDKNNLNTLEFEKIDDNFLVLSNLKNTKPIFNKKIKILNLPASINYIKNSVENFLENFKVQFHDILIVNEKLKNTKNDLSCRLTKAEADILSYLIREKEADKNFIKENILKIKTNVQTNSLESHLTRIRKKMTQVDTVVNIQSKKEKLLITF